MERAHRYQGFVFRFDGRDLVVRVENIKMPNDSRMFRVGQDSYEEVQKALLVNVAK